MVNNLEIYRKAKGLTQLQLAKKVGTTRQTIISIENGASVPSVKLAMDICKVLGVTVEKLFEVYD